MAAPATTSTSSTAPRTSANDSGPGTDADTVKSTASTYTIDASIENLTLLDTATKGTGNASDNCPDRQRQATTPSTAPAGADTMQGGKGNDIYIVDNAGDKIDRGREHRHRHWSKSSVTLPHGST